MNDDLSQLYELAYAQCEGELTAVQAARLEELVVGNADLRRRYIVYMQVSAWAELGERPAEFDFQHSPPPAIPASPAASPVLGFLGDAYHGVSGYIGDHDWAKGMLGGTVFLALLFVVLGSIEIISRWRQANHPQPQANEVVKVPAVRAARLTGVFNCRWTGNFHPPRNEVLNVDDYINLASGLAEVTYDSGAKVLLQGPCTYKIESPSSGYLKVGRMTARVVESRGSRVESAKPQAANPKSLIPNPSSLSTTHYPLFTINTPTATVTDLGTEFGVDVDKQGVTDSLVFVGSVKVHTPVAEGEEPAHEETLHANESARVERLGAKQYVVRRVEVKPDGFVRPDQIQDWLAMAREAAAKRKQEAEQPKEPPPDLTQFHRWEAFSKELRNRDDLLAYYDFQHDPNDKRDSENHELLRNKAKTAPGLFGRNYDGQLWGSVNMGEVEGRFPGKHSLKFDWFGDGVKINIPVECKQMTLAAWVNVPEPPSKPCSAFLRSDGASEPGKFAWELLGPGCEPGTVWAGLVPMKAGGVTSPPVFDTSKYGQWQFIAVVVDCTGGKLTQYFNADAVAEAPIDAGAPSVNIGPAWIGAWDAQNVPGAVDRTLHARMDELMIFRAALSPEEIRRLHEQGMGANSGSELVGPAHPTTD